METNLSGATSAQSKRGVVSAQTVLIIAALVAIIGYLMANQPSAETNGGSARSQGSSVTASAEPAVTMPAEEYQPELLYQTAANGNYETAIEVQKILRAKEQLQLEEQMRMAEAARAAGYMTAETEAY